VTVGTVGDIEVQGWHALVTVSLNPNVVLPANATAKIGQTSLLGSTHVELAAPTDQPAEGRLVAGATIPLDRAMVYPTTEQTLSAVSVVLNGGGFAAIGDITRELDIALGGRGATVRDLLAKLATLTTTLDAQKGDIVTALAGLDRLGQQFAAQTPVLAAALDHIPPALAVLVAQRSHLTDALVQLGALSDVANRIVEQDGANIEADLHHLDPILKALADSGNHLTSVLGLLPTFPFPLHEYQHAAKGDYFNLFMTVDLTAKRIDSNFLTGTPLGGIWGGVQADHGGAAAAMPTVADPFSGPISLPGKQRGGR
jgi:phospholipid/cholesterol/gamma-HCH transport system substrate-binding protein